MSQPAYHNGQYLPLDQVHISPLDRGYLLGDGVYEVIPVFQGQSVGLDAHLQRLERSLQQVRIANPHSHEQWRHILTTLSEQTTNPNHILYLQITRGVAPRDHGFPANTAPSAFAMTKASPPPTETIQALKALRVTDQRWGRCDIKSIGLQANALARQQALDAQADDAILIRDGLAIEGAASNLFIVRDDQLITPPQSHKLLPGITRQIILDLARAHPDQHPLKITERDIYSEELDIADEIWLTSSNREIVPIQQIDQRQLEAPGPHWHTINRLYQQHKFDID